MKTVIKIAAATALTTLCACGGGGGSSPDISTPEGFSQVLRADAARFESIIRSGPNDTTGLFFTNANNIPSSGNVVFNGTAAGGVLDDANPGRDLAMRGDARVTVAFGANADVTGTVSNIYVAELPDISDVPSEVFEATGTITLANGAVGVSSASAVTTQASGTLGYDGTTSTLNGTLAGNLLGNRDAPGPDGTLIRAISLTGETQSATQGATTFTTELILVGEN